MPDGTQLTVPPEGQLLPDTRLLAEGMLIAAGPSA